MKKAVVKLDVRQEIQQGREPFGLIMRTVGQLQPKESLLLVAPFEPVPLFGVMANRGFSHTARALPDGSYEILFEQASPVAVSEISPSRPECPAQPKTKVIEVEARGLEPPQPLVTILEALERLPSDASLRAHTDRKPQHLLSLLEQRGIRATTTEQGDGSYVTHIETH